MTGLGGEASPGGPGAVPLSGGSSASRRGTIKRNFTAAPQAGKEHFVCLFQIKNCLKKSVNILTTWFVYLPTLCQN